MRTILCGWRRREEGLQEWRESRHEHMCGNTIPIRPEQLAIELVKACPQSTLYVTDTGYVGVGRRLHGSFGREELTALRGSLGWAFPAAMRGQNGGT